VAYYNNLHFLDLIRKLPDTIDIVIYNKSGKEISTAGFPEKKLEIRDLENIGREGETYLRHIIENYDNLDDYTIFIQDDTNNHITDNTDFVEKTMYLIETKQPFYQYKCIWNGRNYNWTRMIIDGMCEISGHFPNPYSIRDLCDQFEIVLPSLYYTEIAAFFMVHKDTIRRRPLDFYIRLKEWLLSDEKNGFVLEHTWKIIFSEF